MTRRCMSTDHNNPTEQIDKNTRTSKGPHPPVAPESYPMSQKLGALSNPCTGITTRALEHSLTTRSKQQRRTGSLFDSPVEFPCPRSGYALEVTNAPSAFQILVPSIITRTTEASLDTVTALQVPRYERIKGLRTQGVQKLYNKRWLRLVEAAYPLCQGALFRPKLFLFGAQKNTTSHRFLRTS